MGDDSRAALKADREKKKKASKDKKARRKYRKLDHDNQPALDPHETIEIDDAKDEPEHDTRDTKVQPDDVKESTAPALHAAQSHHKP